MVIEHFDPRGRVVEIEVLCRVSEVVLGGAPPLQLRVS